MSRSKWKGNYIDACLTKQKHSKKQLVWSRSSTILPIFLGQTVLVHTGKIFKKIFITKEKLGFKFGQFIFTRKHVKKKKIVKPVSKKKTANVAKKK